MVEATGAAETVLELRGVRRVYDDQVVLDGIDLEIPLGVMYGVRGESGSGKSTLARIIAGLDREYSGTRRGGDAHLVFQDSLQALNPRIRLSWSLAEAASDGSLRDTWRILHRNRDRLTDALTEVGLPHDLLDRRPGRLSGGQRQRAAIARALLSHARLIVLDEPVAALDPSVQARILNLLVRLHRHRALSIVVISHDHAVLDYLCDRQYHLQGGRLWTD